FWEARLEGSERSEASLRFSDPEGLDHELVVSASPDPPLIAKAPDIPEEFALQGFEGVRAFASNPSNSRPLLADTLGFEGDQLRGDLRGGHYSYDAPPAVDPIPGAGTVHHVAFASRIEDLDAWQQRVAATGAHVTPVIDRFYFRSIYFREPGGVLFEIATMGPGFSSDEDPEHLGERLSLPPKFESRREELERTLTPLPNRR
ncbi:MAG: VOC family protein, partial [Thermoleophilaceae bacterium]|nr:VOC family protein [Thermoleophilaceae bacterium]